MAKTYRLGAGGKAVNAIVKTLLRLGVRLPSTYLLTVTGRRSGKPYTTPVTLVEHPDQRWLVSPYGTVAWVRNARASGQVILTRGRRATTVSLTEVGPNESAKVLKEYVTKVAVVRPFFDARPDAPVAAFAAEADRHPVFRIDD